MRNKVCQSFIMQRQLPWTEYSVVGRDRIASHFGNHPLVIIYADNHTTSIYYLLSQYSIYINYMQPIHYFIYINITNFSVPTFVTMNSDDALKSCVDKAKMKLCVRLLLLDQLLFVNTALSLKSVQYFRWPHRRSLCKVRTHFYESVCFVMELTKQVLNIIIYNNNLWQKTKEWRYKCLLFIEH